MAILTYAHIDITPEGIPFISGTQTRVEEIVLDHLAYDWDADKIHEQYSDLRLSQIYSALAYYHDHQAEMDREIEAGLREVEEIKASLGESPVRLKLRAMGLLP